MPRSPPWRLLLAIAILLSYLGHNLSTGKHTGRSSYDWATYDTFDEVTDQMDSVTAENCLSKDAKDLLLHEDTVPQKPKFNKLLTRVVYPNRTNLLHVHNMALNRAFFFSYAFQKLNETKHFPKQPGLMYYYFSTAADVSANEYNINGSAVFFDNDCAYANWYRNLDFNKTLNLFGPRAWREDDFNEATNWLREPTNTTFTIKDYGAGKKKSNYTNSGSKQLHHNLYKIWLPDDASKKDKDSIMKSSYETEIKYSNETGRFVTDEFHHKGLWGPPAPGQKETQYLPVLWTQPYFDCGQSNKWIMSAVAPVVDQIPRYFEWSHERRFKFVAVVAMDIDFLSIDLNQCPTGIGNEPPNMLGNTARCKTETTMCEPLYGWGFRRGGYQCVCLPGFRYPQYQEGPFLGRDIESATEEEYRDGFNCIPVGLRMVTPYIEGNGTSTVKTKRSVKQQKAIENNNSPKKKVASGKSQPDWVHQHHVAHREVPRSKESQILNKQQRFLRMLELREEEEFNNRKKRLVPRQEPIQRMSAVGKKVKFVPRYTRDIAKHRSKRQTFDQTAFERMSIIINHKQSVNKDNCQNFKREDLELPGDVSYGVEKQFSFQARTALRLSHFLSNFLQNVDRYEEYGNLRGDNLLNIDLIFGEVIANVMGDLKIKASGVFFDVDKFEGADYDYRQFFGPKAYRFEDAASGDGPTGDKANMHYRAIDYAGFPEHYLDEPWFKNVKERWQSNNYGLTRFTEKPLIRSDLAGTSLKRFEMYPMYYRAPKEEDGWWSAPYFDCNGHINDWVITYSIPFFGLNSIRSGLEFKGVVTVDVKLDLLDINQCPSDFHEPNAFKNTARCHYESTYCYHIEGEAFEKGSYKCECKQGFEYPFNSRAWYFDGQKVEEEYRKKVEGLPSEFDTLKCRLADASRAGQSWLIITLTLLVTSLTRIT